jgi:outer membrane receptor for ferrienterochelin and colicin
MSTSPSTRNYFLSGTTPMEYNVQRIEASRGPNAILYGEAGPGGGVNYMTKGGIAELHHRALPHGFSGFDGCGAGR